MTLEEKIRDVEEMIRSRSPLIVAYSGGVDSTCLLALATRSAGDQVLLHNGVPLYGVDSAPSFEPLQRMTATGIDAAGNLWCLNNWKYNFLIDITTNPGGDGVVIFVGLATPLKKN